MNRIIRRVLAALHRRTLEREMTDEMRQHIEMETDDRIRSGATPDRARRDALIAFGSRERWAEEARAARGWSVWDAVRQDLRYAIRALAAAPGFTVAAVLTLAIAIGANTAVFSVVNGVLLRPLGFENPGRLVRVFEYRQDEIGTGRGTISYANFADMRERADLWQTAAAYDEWRVLMTVDGVAEQFDGAIVDGAWFEVLGIRPALGRFFGPDEATPGGPGRVVLSWRLFQERFGGDPDLIGRVLQINGADLEVIGVAPPELEDPDFSGGAFGAPRLWRSPATYFTSNSRGSRSFAGLVRLAPGVTLAQAQQEADAIQAQLRTEYPENNAEHIVRLVPLKETIVASVSAELWMLLVAVGLVLLIACANVGNLMLVRATTRSREMSVRAALGASRARLVRQLAAESLLLAVVGAVLGTIIAWNGTRALTAVVGEHLPRADQVAPDAGVLTFTLVITVATAVLFGLLPAMHGSRVNLVGALRDSDRSAAGSRRQNRFRAFVVAGQVALAIVVLLGAGLLTRSLIRLQSVDPGLGARSEAATMQLLTPPDYEGASLTAYYERLFEAVRGVSGVRAAGVVDLLPMGGSFNGGPFTIVGLPEPLPQERPEAELRAAGGEVLDALGILVIAGRAPNAGDRDGTLPVVAVNRSLAERYFPGQNPIGRQIRTYDLDRTIVGVVGDVRQFTLDRAPEPTIWFPNEQAPVWMRDDPTLVVRLERDPTRALAELRAAVRSADAGTAISELQTLEQVIDRTLVLARSRTLLLALFSAIAFVLAIIGIYGTVSYTVTRRTREFGIRMAMGAQRRDILRLVLVLGPVPVALGTATGILGALFGSRLLEGLLYEISPLDARTYVVVPLTLLLVAALAAVVPARRAAGAAPVQALREE